MRYSGPSQTKGAQQEGFCAQVIMRRVIVCVSLVLCVLALPALARAQQLTPGNPNSPAATLLLPYFEVDLDNTQGLNTLFTVNNASATAILTHVTIWTDLGVPVFAFNVYLTGYDAQPFDLRAVLKGTVPTTASAGQDPGDTRSPKGQLSQDINFASCSGQLPPPSAAPTYPDYLRAALTGGPSTFHSGKCVGRNLGTPSIARGYVTVDTVNNCTLRLPGDLGYFGPGGSGDATNQNTLWGDYMYINPSLDEASGDALVHVQASGTDPQTSVAGQYTFYGRLNNFLALDNREPLSTLFAARFVAPKDFKTVAKARRKALLPPSTELIVWRDPKTTTQPFVCGANPTWYPLGQEQVRAIDEQEHQEVLTFSPSAQPFPAVTQRVTVGSTNLPVTTASGWMYLNLNTTVSGVPNPPEDTAASQAWVSILQRVQQGPNGGRYDVGFRAIRLDSAENPSHSTIIP
jgi:hypothetical protein